LGKFRRNLLILLAQIMGISVKPAAGYQYNNAPNSYVWYVRTGLALPTGAEDPQRKRARVNRTVPESVTGVNPVD
jgi:hypothetical protein